MILAVLFPHKLTELYRVDRNTNEEVCAEKKMLKSILTTRDLRSSKKSFQTITLSFGLIPVVPEVEERK